MAFTTSETSVSLVDSPENSAIAASNSDCVFSSTKYPRRSRLRIEPSSISVCLSPEPDENRAPIKIRRIMKTTKRFANNPVASKNFPNLLIHDFIFIIAPNYLDYR